MITKLEDGHLLFDTIYIGQWHKPQKADLSLRLEQGNPVVYSKESMIVDFPGEYELVGYNIIAFVTPNKTTLNYVIRFWTKKVAYIQHVSALDDDILSDMDTWFVLNESLKDAIERRELWGDIVIVE